MNNIKEETKSQIFENSFNTSSFYSCSSEEELESPSEFTDDGNKESKSRIEKLKERINQVVGEIDALNTKLDQNISELGSYLDIKENINSSEEIDKDNIEDFIEIESNESYSEEYISDENSQNSLCEEEKFISTIYKLIYSDEEVFQNKNFEKIRKYRKMEVSELGDEKLNNFLANWVKLLEKKETTKRIDAFFVSVIRLLKDIPFNLLKLSKRKLFFQNDRFKNNVKLYVVGFRGFCKVFKIDENKFIDMFHDFIILLDKNIAKKFFSILHTHDYMDDKTYKNKIGQLKIIDLKTKEGFSEFIMQNKCFQIICKHISGEVEIKNKSLETRFKKELEFCLKYCD